MIPLLIGLGAFVILAIMAALLGLSDREEERNDAVTQEVILKAITGPTPTQKEKR